MLRHQNLTDPPPLFANLILRWGFIVGIVGIFGRSNQGPQPVGEVVVPRLSCGFVQLDFLLLGDPERHLPFTLFSLVCHSANYPKGNIFSTVRKKVLTLVGIHPIDTGV
jgi:hypothetical protein